MTDERSAWIALAHAVEPGEPDVGGLVAERGPVEVAEMIAAGRSGLRSGPGLQARLAGFDAQAAADRAQRCGARILTPADSGWPAQLADLGPRAPAALWVAGAGDLRLLALRSLAVVGARACTHYGEEIACSWAATAAEQGWNIVSGAAYGIDAAAHRGALSAGGATVAIVAGGVDVAYPRAHVALLDAIRADGLVVSETPPGEPVRRQRFLSRNRVIAALGRATLVVEAAFRSGTAATAHAAASMNRPVLAVPGPVTSPASAGCHRMIRDGEALCVVDVDDVLGLLDLRAMPAEEHRAPESTAWDRLADRERRVLDALPARGGLDVDAVVRAAAIAPIDAIAALAILQATGLAREDSGRWRACAVR